MTAFVRQPALFGSTIANTKLFDLNKSLAVLEEFNRDYLIRMREGRNEGLTPQAIEFKRVQALKADTIKAEREILKAATIEVVEASSEVVLGIMAESGTAGIRALQNWVGGLSLSRGILTAVDHASGKEIAIESLKDRPVYIKYNSEKGGDAYMKSYDGGNVGVTLQPKLKSDTDDNFRQYGDLVLALFK